MIPLFPPLLSPRTPSLRGCLFIACTLLVALAPAARGEPLTAASDPAHLWRSVYDDQADRTRLFHHPADDAEPRLRRIPAMTGRVLTQGLAADDGRLWLFFAGGAVQQVIAEPAETAVGWSYTTRIAPPLPEGATPTAVAAGAGRAWALVRVERLETLQAIEAPATATTPTDTTAPPRSSLRDRQRRIALGLPPTPTDADAAPSSDASSGPDANAGGNAGGEAGGEAGDNSGGNAGGEAEAPPQPDSGEAESRSDTADDAADDDTPDFPVHRLLRERGASWEAVDLPDDWPHLAPARVVCLDPEAARPTLVVLIDRDDPTDDPSNPPALAVYRPTDAGWDRQDVTLEGSGIDSRFQVAAVQGQLVIAVNDATAGGRLSPSLHVVRPDRTVSLSASLDAPAGDPWRIGPWAEGVGLFTAPRAASPGQPQPAPSADPSPSDPIADATPLTLTAVSLQGRTIVEPITLEPTDVSPWEGRADYFVLMGVMMLAMALTLATWRRAAQGATIVLEAARPAELWRRLLAAAIDLAPPAAIAMLAFGIGPAELLATWPPQPQGLTWLQMAPAGLTIALFLLHTIASEALTGRTLGKRLLNLHVLTDNGRAPARWQIAARGLLKVLDLVLWMLLIVAIITPARQRLGDLVARTVVVLPTDADHRNTQDT